MSMKYLKPALALLTIIASLGIVSPTWAQRDAGAKARGDYSRGFDSPRRTMNYYRPSYLGARSSSTSQESLSVEPIDFHAGDQIKFTANTPLRMGEKTVADVSKGTETKVLKTIGRWIGVEVQHDGKPVRGWVTFHAVEHADRTN